MFAFITGTELSDERKTSSSVSVADSIHGTDTLIIFSPLEAFEVSLHDCPPY